MSEISYGTPGAIASLPTPAATVNIASSTNATPIVVTSSGAHGLQTGQALIVNGHLVNTNANGIWLAHVLSSTTFRLLTFAGANSVGNGVGVATGTIQSLALPGITIPEDAVDDRTAASVNVPFEGLHDMVQWLAYKVLANVVTLKGGVLGTAVGSNAVLAGTTTISGAVTASGAVELSGVAYLSGLTRFRDPLRLTDAAATISTASADVALLAPTTAGATRTIKLQTTTAPVPLEGERWLVVGADTMGATPGSYNYNMQREDGTHLCAMYGIGTWALFQFEGGLWRGLKHSGVNTVTPADGSVVVGAGW